MGAFRPSLYAIDFGTSNSLCAAANAEQVHPPIPLEPVGLAQDPTVLRSILYFPLGGRPSFGGRALADYVEAGQQGRLIRSIKKHLPSRLFDRTWINQRAWTIDELVGVLLREMRERANRFFDADVRRVVLGRPARFASEPEDDALAEKRLGRAAELAGFHEVHFCPEPVAAARAFRRQLDTTRLVLVADLGGGTSDFTVIMIGPEPYRSSDVLAVSGISVAGDSLDSAIMRRRVSRVFGADVTYRVPMGANVLGMPPHLIEKLCNPADASLLADRDAQTFLRNVQSWSLGRDDRDKIDRFFTFIEDALGFPVFEAIESAKRELSEADRALVRFSYPTVEIREPITRAEFEAWTEPRTQAILEKLDETVQSASIEHSDIDLVCATGGTARVPRIATALRERFGAKKLQQFDTFHSVILGLAEEAHDRAISA